MYYFLMLHGIMCKKGACKMYILYSQGEIKNFQKMLEKIIFSNDIKRLNNKTQLYSSDNGDHYRNRLTHTLEVVNISKTIANQAEDVFQNIYKNVLNGSKVISMDLVEAIAYAHDLGHTPFGHIGERTLQKILKREDDLGGLIIDSKKTEPDEKKFNGWQSNIKKTSFFKHNVNSLKILLENEVYDWRILDGVLKHTNISFDKCDPIPVDNLNWLKYILKGKNEKKLFDKYFGEKSQFVSNIPLTIEAQIVAISDEIAQVYSDLDDTLRYNKILKLSNMLKIENKSTSMRHNNKQLLVKIKESLIKEVVDYFQELISNKLSQIKDEDDFKKTFSNNKENYFLFKKNQNEDESIMKKISNSLNKKIDLTTKSTFYKVCFINQLKITYALTTEKVRMSDAKAQYIIRQLFKAYYNNPNLLNDKVLNFIEKEYYDLNGKEKKKLDDIIEEMKTINSRCTDDYKTFLVGNVYIMAIANYIAKMTDDYALKEYKKNYL